MAFLLLLCVSSGKTGEGFYFSICGFGGMLGQGGPPLDQSLGAEGKERPSSDLISLSLQPHQLLEVPCP